MKQFLTAREVAERLQVHYLTACRYCSSGQLKAIKLNRDFRIRPEWLEEFERSREVQPAASNPPVDRRDRNRRKAAKTALKRHRNTRKSAASK